MSRRFRFAPPNASAMLESLRGLGYSPETALADTIDNSISAGATEVDLLFDWDGGNSSVTVVDNGRGMSPSELECAMRLGGSDPLAGKSLQRSRSFRTGNEDSGVLSMPKAYGIEPQ